MHSLPLVANLARQLLARGRSAPLSALGHGARGPAMMSARRVSLFTDSEQMLVGTASSQAYAAMT